MRRPLPSTFFDRPADIVARDLIGCTLCVKKSRSVERLPITETEAYMGPHDLACHAARGRTDRTDVMFRRAGTIYVYLVYGMYDMLNIVTGPTEYPAAVLIRGVGTFDGPGKLTRELNITREMNGCRLGRMSGLWIEDRRRLVPRIETTPRIGVAYAGPWAKKKLRFVQHA